MAKRKYADQRARNVSNMTAKQRNALDRKSRNLDRAIKRAAKAKRK